MVNEIKKYMSSENLSYMLQKLKTKLDETYSTIEYVDDVIGKVHEYDTILTIPKDKLNELIDGTGNTKDTTYDVDTLNIIETMYTVELEDKIYEREAYYDEIAGHISLYAYIYFDNEITAYAGGSSSEKNIRIILQEHKDVNYKDDETKTRVFVEVTGITEEFTSDAVIKLKKIKSDLLYDYATKEYVDDAIITNAFDGDYSNIQVLDGTESPIIPWELEPGIYRVFGSYKLSTLNDNVNTLYEEAIWVVVEDTSVGYLMKSIYDLSSKQVLEISGFADIERNVTVKHMVDKEYVDDALNNFVTEEELDAMLADIYGTTE